MLTDLHGVTGRDIMDRLIAGERDPKALAECARTRARRKIPQLRESLEGAEFFTAHHAALLKSILKRIDSITAEIDELSQVIEDLLAPYEEQLQQAGSQPGWGRRSAQDVIAETGADMTRFPTGGHLASWCGRTPLDKQSGARKGQRRHKRGNKYITAVLGETAVAAGNTQMKVFHALLSNPGTRYQDLGPDYYERQRDHNRHVSRLIGELGNLGYDVTLCRKPQPEDAPAA